MSSLAKRDFIPDLESGSYSWSFKIHKTLRVCAGRTSGERIQSTFSIPVLAQTETVTRGSSRHSLLKKRSFIGDSHEILDFGLDRLLVPKILGTTGTTGVSDLPIWPGRLETQ